MKPPTAVVDVGGIPFRVSALEDATDWVLRRAEEHTGGGVAVRLSNAYCVALASKQRSYRALLTTAGVNFPDGAPVVAVMRLLRDGGRTAERVRGPSLFRLVLQRGVPLGIGHFFLGSTPETLVALERAAERIAPGVKVVGTYSPPFADLDDAYLADLMRRVDGRGADIVWVSLGTPKQDFAAQVLADRAGVVSVGVGAGFDFLAGTKPEAPVWVQRAGVEWAFRLASEPARLWQRYLFGNGRFLAIAGRQLVGAAVRGAARSGPRRR